MILDDEAKIAKNPESSDYVIVRIKRSIPKWNLLIIGGHKHTINIKMTQSNQIGSCRMDFYEKSYIKRS